MNSFVNFSIFLLIGVISINALVVPLEKDSHVGNLTFRKATAFSLKNITCEYNTTIGYTNGPQFPPDDGGNFGDLIHHRQVDNNRLVLRELLINYDTFDSETEFDYKKTIAGASLTQVIAVNLGRQRAVINYITTSDEGLVEVNGLINVGEQIRVLVEAYAL